jgi:hypothetical protein
MSAIPKVFRAGDGVSWTETEIDPAATSPTAYLRTSAGAAPNQYLGGTTAGGLVIAATPSSSVTNGWQFLISSVDSAAMPAGDWQAQIVATLAGQQQTIRVSSFSVLPSLAFTGTPTAFETRSQAQIDLDAVEAAIRALTSGAQEYWVGTGGGGRRVRRADLAELIAWRDRLVAKVKAEARAEDEANGRNSERGIFVRFT